MIWLTLGPIWFFGTTLTLRTSMLMMKNLYQRRRNDPDRYPRPDWDDYLFGIVVMTIFWPVSLFVLLACKLAFPRGVETQFDKERKLQAALRKAERDALDQERRIKELEKQVLAWTPKSYDRSGAES